MKKVILIIVDGMRPDSLVDIDYVEKLKKESSYTMNAQTVFPSGTLSAHVSLFHSVPPSVHGIETNTYVPLKEDVKDLVHVLCDGGVHTGFFYNWETLKEITSPYTGILDYSCYILGRGMDYTRDTLLTKSALHTLTDPDFDGLSFSFLYLGWTDVIGHSKGWMSDEYMECVKNAWVNIENVIKTLGDDYTYIITADHGGHDKNHGSDLPEDMTTPLFIRGEGFAPGKIIENANIMDIAPTVTKIFGVEADSEWQGKPLL